MSFNLPIALTWLRIILIPVFVGVYYLPAAWLSLPAKNWLAMSVFTLAAITDWADGYLARKLGQTSAFGAFLDPVADKILVLAMLILHAFEDRELPARAHVDLELPDAIDDVVVDALGVGAVALAARLGREAELSAAFRDHGVQLKSPSRTVRSTPCPRIRLGNACKAA